MRVDTPKIQCGGAVTPLIHKQVGLVIRMFRQKRGLTQAEVAESIGTSRPALSAIETGARPPRSALPRLARLFGTTVADLLDRKHAPTAFPAFEAPFHEATLKHEPTGIVMLTTTLAETTAVHVPKLGGKCFAVRPPARVLPLWDRSFKPEDILVFSSQEPKDGDYAYLQTGSSPQAVGFSAVRRIRYETESQNGRQWIMLEGCTPDQKESRIPRSGVLGLWKLVARIRLEADFVKQPERVAVLQRLDQFERERAAKAAAETQREVK